MALKLEDPGNGFRHGKVVAFINESMARHEKGSAFYLENISLSWAAVEDKLRAILEDHQVSSEAKEACVWGSLALGVRFAHRQSHLHRYRVEWLYYFAKLHKSVARALVSDMKLLKAQQDVERKEAASLLQLAHARLAEVQKERDLLRWRLLQAESAAKVPGLATDSGTGTEGAGEEEEEAGATAPTAAASGATGGGGRQKDVEGSEAAEGAEELCGDLMQLLRVENQKIYTSGGQREGDLRSMDTAMLYLPGIAKSRRTVSQDCLTGQSPVQLPASFPSSHSCPSFPFPDAPTSSPPAAPFTAGAPSQTSPCWGPSDSSLWSDVGGQGMGPQEPQRDGRGSDHHQQGRPPVLQRPGEKTCFHCGRGIWL
ncbi:testis-expressed protein 13B [Phocoena sinus]|uniref:testis-expressed protein 13B n=1 Tax=Phocoena sinus TaxID=42100 RepID=UPI0013C4E284|nr:testis-expressed protein 13B [Phocoena sinus]